MNFKNKSLSYLYTSFTKQQKMEKKKTKKKKAVSKKTGMMKALNLIRKIKILRCKSASKIFSLRNRVMVNKIKSSNNHKKIKVKSKRKKRKKKHSKFKKKGILYLCSCSYCWLLRQKSLIKKFWIKKKMWSVQILKGNK